MPWVSMNAKPVRSTVQTPSKFHHCGESIPLYSNQESTTTHDGFSQQLPPQETLSLHCSPAQNPQFQTVSAEFVQNVIELQDSLARYPDNVIESLGKWSTDFFVDLEAVVFPQKEKR
jgi:hypothetical protein